MTQITHKEAHRLIQLRANQELDLISKSLLDTHLEQCVLCSVYAREISEVEELLQRVTNRKWNKPPAPLSIAALLRSSQNKFGKSNHLVATRMAAIVVAVMALLISTWQFSRMTFSPTPEVFTSALPIPTPSTYLTSTRLSLQGCEYVVYQVGENDSLESISQQFAVAKSDIMAFNQMTSEIIFIDQELKIPLCKSTPTGTIDTPTTTITPQFSPMATTPG